MDLLSLLWENLEGKEGNLAGKKNHFANEDKLKLLESVLPPRTVFKMPVGDHVEEVDLNDYDPNERGSHSSNREAYASDDEDHIHGSGIQCAHQ
ncbi:hypothetical protein QE152_g64 [Popillia japonica]|uniref:Uncharacterized protein n=1 Tax=Popillia japonica TaxID=7064 RepID=A0AAW1NGQ0_POPJA